MIPLLSDSCAANGFVRELEGGTKPTMRIDKVNRVLAVFDYHLEAVKDGQPGEENRG